MSGDHRAARIRSYELLELLQTSPMTHQVDSLLAEARAHEWHDVEFMVHYARVAEAMDTGRPWDHLLEDLFSTAEDADNDALRSIALTARSELAATGDAQGRASADSDVARAVALLDDGNGDPVDRPAAFIGCAMSYHLRGLWELSVEMLDRAAAALAHIPAGYSRVGELDERVIAVNQFESVVPLACSLAEIGERELAAERARRRPRLSPRALAEMPPTWALEYEAMDDLLAALAGEEQSLPPHEHLERLHPTHRSRYRACIHLGQAVRAADRGDTASAAAHAEIALLHVDHEFVAGVRPYILSLTTLADRPAPAWRRYAQTIARHRWEAHLTDTAAARTQIELARVVLENQRLSERAYVDELTGLANRHAYSRHVSRLRHERDDEQVAAFMIDVDRFKAVNDAHGHTVGDEVLRRVASVLVESTRAGDLAVRMGGDEFLVFLSGHSQMDLTARGGELLDGVGSHPWDEVVPGLQITISVGLSAGPSTEIDRLVHEADQRLYEAKSAGRGRLVHE
ncbi:MAG: GGDEF domain-containing protein [Kineosporiaceae bacterium]|nr:GGDEF domain-containing protein [Kineosporiaceae bacterium]